MIVRSQVGSGRFGDWSLRLKLRSCRNLHLAVRKVPLVSENFPRGLSSCRHLQLKSIVPRSSTSKAERWLEVQSFWLKNSNLFVRFRVLPGYVTTPKTATRPGSENENGMTIFTVADRDKLQALLQVMPLKKLPKTLCIEQRLRQPKSVKK